MESVVLQTPRMRLDLLDAVAGMHPVDAAVRCLVVAHPDLLDPAGLSLGQRDAALLALRARLLGDRLVARTTCGSCGEQLTLDLSVTDLMAQMGSQTDPRWTFEHHGRELAVRALTSRDLAQAAAAPSAGQARALLVAAALDEAATWYDGLDEELTEELADAVAASLAQHDPGSELLLTGTCTGCGEAWSEVLDPAQFVAAEFTYQGTRLLTEVAQLAHAFGWTEADVLALSDQRRRAYLDLATEMAG